MINCIDYRSETGVSLEELEFLYQELEKVWNNRKISAFHREVFYKYLGIVNPRSATTLIVKEIDKMERGSSVIIKLTEKISLREETIGKLRVLSTKPKKISNSELEILEIESANLLVKLRSATISVIRLISSWKKEFIEADCEFYWNQIYYLDKIRHDLDFIKTIGRLKFSIRDPLFLFLDSSRTSKKTKTILKPSKNLEKKIKKIQKFLNYGFEEIGTIALSAARAVSDQESQHIFS